VSSVSITLSEAQATRLSQVAEELGVQAEELARAAVTDLLTERSSDFEAAARHVIAKNRDLYERLS